MKKIIYKIIRIFIGKRKFGKFQCWRGKHEWHFASVEEPKVEGIVAKQCKLCKASWGGCENHWEHQYLIDKAYKYPGWLRIICNRVECEFAANMGIPDGYL